MCVDANRLNKLMEGYQKFGYTPPDFEIAADYWHSCLTNEEKARMLGTEDDRWDTTIMTRYRECITEIAEAIIKLHLT